MRPGVEVVSTDQPVPRSAPTDTGVWFAVGVTAIGPTTPTLVRSLSQYVNTYGDRSGGQDLYDAVDAYFREGGSQVYIGAIPTTPSTRSGAKKAAAPEGDAPTQQAGTVIPTQALADALALFNAQLGPGQVSAPGQTASAAHSAILDHVAANNRVALLEAPVGDAAALTAAATALRSHADASYGSLWAPQAVIPGVAPGTTRSIGFASIEAGIISRNDVSYNANVPAAGTLGQSLYSLGLSDQYTDQEYQDLNEASVDCARVVYGGIEAYGYRSLVDPATVPLWWNFGHARLRMGITAQADAIGERYVFTQIDGRRRTINDFGGELAAMLVPFYEAGALYGDTADEAFGVNVGAQVNTEETIANGELHAVLQVRMSPFAELVVIQIVKVATTEALAA